MPMRELLALPAWDNPATTLDAWKQALADLGQTPRTTREDGETWLEIGAAQLRGYVVLEDMNVAAINFELHAADPTEGQELLARAASALGWELHDDDDETEDDEDES